VYSESEIVKQLKIADINLEGIKKSSYKRIWLVLSSWGEEVIDQLSKDIKEYLDRNYVMEECKELAGLTIYLYQIK
jgi:ClpP class serine protease